LRAAKLLGLERRDLGQTGVIEDSKRALDEGEAAAIWQSVRRLVKTNVDWEDEEYQNISALLSGAQTSKNQRVSGRIKYTFDPLLAKNIKYAVTLYEILEGYVNRREPTCLVAIDEFRSWLKVPEDSSYADWKYLRRRVIDPAISEINAHTEDAGFSVSYEGVREGKAFTKIKFEVTKTEGRTDDEKTIKKRRQLTSAVRCQSRALLILTIRRFHLARRSMHFATNGRAMTRTKSSANGKITGAPRVARFCASLMARS
jgi:Initiator Replication protein